MHVPSAIGLIGKTHVVLRGCYVNGDEYDREVEQGRQAES